MLRVLLMMLVLITLARLTVILTSAASTLAVKSYCRAPVQDGNNRHLLDQLVEAQAILDHHVQLEQAAAQGLEEAQELVLAIIPEQNKAVTALAQASSHAQATYRAGKQAQVRYMEVMFSHQHCVK
jgi:hypothetical protein